MNWTTTSVSERTGPMRKLLLVLAVVILSAAVQAKDVPAVTKRFVNDYAGALAAEDAQLLEQKLKGYFDSTSTQIVIVLENSLDGDDLFSYSQRLAQTWGIGEKGKNNGLLIYAAISDRKLQVQVGYGLEGSIPDALTSRVRRNIMNPAFKAGNYAAGLDEATTVFMQAASGEFVNDRDNSGASGFRPGFIVVFIIIIILIVLFSRGGGRGNRGSRGWGGPVFWGGTFGSGGFSSGGGGGGGFGGFGGGSFGGGGSGGSW